ncbi:MAG TPA: DEAD/DEAH box helicase [Alphaproteobacteria bacterium]|nr:DEAD/DEAH box helicase [Alphaproteobacteria bacterium]
MQFADFGLNEAILKSITENGFSAPTPIQAGTIAHTLKRHDVMACAPTGSGKTAAFVLPALHKIVSGPSKVVKGHGPRVLVLTPTRELSAQIADTIKLFTKHVRVSSGVVIGGVSYGPQYTLLSRPLDMLVATPGRLIDHIQERRVDLSRVELLILDEADRMLDMGFLRPVERIIDALPQGQFRPQTLLFSATFSPAIEKVSAKVLRDPVRVELAAAKQSHVDITQQIIYSDNNEHKMEQLKHLLEHGKIWQAIIFAATKHGADKLADKIGRWGHKTAALHGNLKQNQRKRVIQAMHDASLKVLVATDVAARGLDVKKLSHVINFDLPNVSEDYVHRIGRTGRAGETGVAISLVTPPDMPLLRDIEKILRRTFKLESIAELPSIMSETEFRALRVPKTIRGGKGGGSNPRGGTHTSHGPGSSTRKFGDRPASHSGPKKPYADRPRSHSAGNHAPRADKPYKPFVKNGAEGGYVKREGGDGKKPNNYAKRPFEKKFGDKKFGDKKPGGFGGYKGKSAGGQYNKGQGKSGGGKKPWESKPQRPTRVFSSRED